MEEFDIELNEFRRIYLDNNEFVIMIRDENDLINKNSKDDIVYYNGIKAFKIVKEKNKIKNIIIEDNIYKINTTNVKKNDKEELLKEIKKIRELINGYLPLNLSRIEFEIASKSELYEETKKKFINDIREYIKKGYTSGKIEKEIKVTKRKNKKEIYFIDFDKELLKTDLNSMLEIEYKFIKNFKLNSEGKEPYIIRNINFLFSDTSENQITIKNEEIGNFNDIIKECICNYEILTKEELEKKYQHHFMLSKNTLNKLDVFNNLYRFEEEYYTDEEKKNELDRGRVDCIFLKIDKNLLTDIYLIELKVNENVVGKSNGIHKHLIDIEKLLSDEEKKYNFIDNLYKRVSYRREIESLETLKDLEEFTKTEKQEYYNKIKFHFYTIISFSDTSKERENKKINFENIKNHINSVSKLIEDFDDATYVKNNKVNSKNSSKKDNKLPYESKVLSKHMNRLNKQLKCDTRIYYDLYWGKNDIDSKGLYKVYYEQNLIDNKLNKEIDKYIEYLKKDNNE